MKTFSYDDITNNSFTMKERICLLNYNWINVISLLGDSDARAGMQRQWYSVCEFCKFKYFLRNHQELIVLFSGLHDLV